MRVDIGEDVRLFVDVEGTGWHRAGDRLEQRPTLLLLHGGPGMDHSGYRDFFGDLADVAQVVYYDHRGNGRSDRDETANWNLATWADDVVRLCDALEIVDPIVLGNSFGGMVAMTYAARHPGHPGALVISSSAASHDHEQVVARFGDLGGDAVAEAADAFWRDPASADIGAYLEVCGPHYTQSDGNIFDERATIVNAAVLQHFGGGEGRTMDLCPGLAAVTCPTLLLAGRLDPVCPIEGMDRIADAIPDEHLEYRVFERCGHGVFRDAPDEARTVLREFIDRVTAG